MINWLVGLFKSWLGHWLLKEEEDERRRAAERRLKEDEEKRQKQAEIVRQNYEIAKTVTDLDNVEF